MWLDCEIQLLGSPEQRLQQGVHIRVETKDGHRRPFPVPVSTLRYDLEQFYAQPAWGIDGPADCYQTGPGYVYFEPQGLVTGAVVGYITTLHEFDPQKPLVVGFGQLHETADIDQRLPA